MNAARPAFPGNRAGTRSDSAEPAAGEPSAPGVLVLLRHGYSVGNAEGGFTGWLDVPLAPRGRTEAARAGALLVEQARTPTVVHASVLQRAVDTARIVADVVVAAGSPRPPIRCSWRLNERHYGALQGRSKVEVLDRYGGAQFTRWRRSYWSSPPPLAPDDPAHPRRDPRYAEIPDELLPGAESLADVRARLLPYWRVIVDDLRRGESVLVVAHSNSLRALCMHLDGLGEREVEGLEVPTGVPLHYDLSFAPDGRSEPRPVVRGGVYLDPVAARAGIAEMAVRGWSRACGDGA